MTVSDQIYNASWLLPASIAAINPFVITYVIWFLVVYEPRRRPETIVYSVSNLSTVGIWLFGTCYFSSSAYSTYSKETSSIAFAVAYLSIGCAEWCYLWFSFKRSEELLRKRWSMKFLVALKTLLFLYPIAIMLPPLKLFIPATVSSSIANLIFVGLFSMQCMIVCIMDGVMAWTFVQHIRDMGKDIRLVSPKLSIIANYGLMACMFAFSTVGCVAASFVCRFVDPELQSDETYNAYHILWILKDIFIEMMGIAIVVMRISLAFVETNDTTHILDRIQQSFAACESITSKKGSKTQHTSIITTKIDRNRVNNLSVPYEQ